MTDPVHNIIGKVSKLLNTAADSAATPSEAATALSIAQRLMLQHRISEQQIREHARQEAFALGEFVRVEDLSTLELGLWQIASDGWLGMAAAEFCGCKAYRAWGQRETTKHGRTWMKSVKTMTAYGLPADLAVAQALFVGLREQARAARKVFCKTRMITAGSTAGRSFIDAFAQKILTRVREAREEQKASKEKVEVRAAKPAEGALALVCAVADYEEQLTNALVLKHKQLGVGKARTRYTRVDWAARIAGAAAGSQVKLSREVIR